MQYFTYVETDSQNSLNNWITKDVICYAKEMNGNNNDKHWIVFS